MPFLIVLKISLSDYGHLSIPPYIADAGSVRAVGRGIKAFLSGLDFENYIFLTEDDLYWKAYLSSLQIALIVSTASDARRGVADCLCHGTGARGLAADALMMLVILPFWTSFLIRVYAWMGILANEGFLNQLFAGPGRDLGASGASSTPTPPSISGSSTPICPS